MDGVGGGLGCDCIWGGGSEGERWGFFFGVDETADSKVLVEREGKQGIFLAVGKVVFLFAWLPAHLACLPAYYAEAGPGNGDGADWGRNDQSQRVTKAGNGGTRVEVARTEGVVVRGEAGWKERTEEAVGCSWYVCTEYVAVCFPTLSFTAGGEK